MKLLTMAITSLGIWIILNPLLGAAVWDDIVFGALVAFISFVSMFRIKE